MKYSYVIIDDNEQSSKEIRAAMGSFSNYCCAASALNADDGLDIILEYRPAIVFLEISPDDKLSNLSIGFISELYRYLQEVPKIVVITKDMDLVLEAIRYEVFDYLIKPIEKSLLRRCLLKFEKQQKSASFNVGILSTNGTVEHNVNSNHYGLSAAEEPIINEALELSDLLPEPENREYISERAPSFEAEKPLIVCVKSYGDYRFIEGKNICYLKADNNSTDIHLSNGEMITAFKTLKHFEGILATPFMRIHNSYIVNADYVSRIHTGNSVCYIKNNAIKLPFSKSYKDNIDLLISTISSGNYLEI